MDRYTVIVKANKRIKIAQYGHEDGNPASAGVEILRFFKTHAPATLKRMVGDLGVFTPEEAEEAKRNRLPVWGFGTQVLEEVISGRLKRVILNISYKDDVFCDWAYIIDLDSNMLLVDNSVEASFSLYDLPGEVEFCEMCGDGW